MHNNNSTGPETPPQLAVARAALLLARRALVVGVWVCALLLALVVYGLVALDHLGSATAHRSLAGVLLMAATVHGLLGAGWRSLNTQIVAVLEDLVQGRQQATELLALRRAVAEVTHRLQQAHTPSELAQFLLSALAPHLGARQSLCALWDEQHSLLLAAARYGGDGADPQEVMTRRPKLGNLLGECARHREVKIIHSPGPDYLKLGSGLGEMEPASIVLFPIQHAGRLFAVLELATVEPFNERGLQLLQDVEPVFAMNLDILQRAERSEELLEIAQTAEENHLLILQAVGEGIWVMDEEGITTFVNQAALRVLGYQEDEVVGQQMHPLVHHHHIDGTPYPDRDCPMSQTLLDGQTREMPHEVLWCKDGTPFPISGITTGFYKHGRRAGAVVVFRGAEA